VLPPTRLLRVTCDDVPLFDFKNFVITRLFSTKTRVKQQSDCTRHTRQDDFGTSPPAVPTVLPPEWPG